MMLKGLVWKLQPPGYRLLVWSLSESVPESIRVLSLFSLTIFYFYNAGEYIRAFRQTPLDPLVSLCLGLQYLHLASQRFPRHRHTCVIQVKKIMMIVMTITTTMATKMMTTTMTTRTMMMTIAMTTTMSREEV